MRLFVDSLRPLADDVLEVSLAASDRGPLPPWNPGAHIEIELPGGLTRQYSLARRTAGEDRWIIAVLREADGRGGSAYIHDELRLGDAVVVRGPRNNFRLIPAPSLQFIASGIGITPILPMIGRCIENGWTWRLDYIGRTRMSLAYLDALPAGDVHVHITSETGRPDLSQLLPAPTAVGARVYACGSRAMLMDLESALSGHEIGTLRTEWFAPRPVVKAVDACPDFEVLLNRSGVMVRVADDVSIVEAAASAGVFIPTSCGEGTCGSCETVLLEGVPDHRDSVLDEIERHANQVMMPCISGSRSRVLVLDA